MSSCSLTFIEEHFLSTVIYSRAAAIIIELWQYLCFSSNDCLQIPWSEVLVKCHIDFHSFSPRKCNKETPVMKILGRMTKKESLEIQCGVNWFFIFTLSIPLCQICSLSYLARFQTQIYPLEILKLCWCKCSANCMEFFFFWLIFCFHFY
jgi:hypothetical protein